MESACVLRRSGTHERYQMLQLTKTLLINCSRTSRFQVSQMLLNATPLHVPCAVCSSHFRAQGGDDLPDRQCGSRLSTFLQSRTPSVIAREHRYLGRRNSAGLNPNCPLPLPPAQQFVLLFLLHPSLRLVQPGTTSHTRYPSYAYATRYVWTLPDGTGPARSRGETPRHRSKG